MASVYRLFKLTENRISRVWIATALLILSAVGFILFSLQIVVPNSTTPKHKAPVTTTTKAPARQVIGPGSTTTITTNGHVLQLSPPSTQPKPISTPKIYIAPAPVIIQPTPIIAPTPTPVVVQPRPVPTTTTLPPLLEISPPITIPQIITLPTIPKL